MAAVGSMKVEVAPNEYIELGEIDNYLQQRRRIVETVRPGDVAVCPECEGKAEVWVCPACEGIGIRREGGEWRYCRRCQGEGVIWECRDCGSTGILYENEYGEIVMGRR